MSTLVERATASRHGLVRRPHRVPASAADPAAIHHASVPDDVDATRSLGGGAARTPDAAMTAAVAEALERVAAVTAPIPLRRFVDLEPHQRVHPDECGGLSPAQRARRGEPRGGREDAWLTETFDLLTNEPRWVPPALVSLGHDHGPRATSSGLAADPSVTTALLRGLQELVERDALMTTWMHQLGGRLVAAPELAAELAPLGGEVEVFDLTPAFSPHPVALVAATTWLAGRPRPSIGVACRARWSDAVEKAFLECGQGMVFVGHRLSARPALVGIAPTAVTGFDEHAVFYAANPDRWAEVPLRRFARPVDRPPDSPSAGLGSAAELEELATSSAGAGVRPSYRELTTPDLVQLGLRVVRVVTPELTPIHPDHNWPYLGGRAADVDWRYPDAAARRGDRTWPSPHPHPLG